MARLPQPIFFLKDNNATKPQLIILTIISNKKHLRFSTGESCHPKLWNKDKQRCIKSKDNPQWQETNFNLDELATFTNKAMLDMVSDIGRIDLIELKKQLEQYSGVSKKDSTSSPYLLDYIEKLINEMRTGARTMPGGELFSSWTIKGYVTLTNHIIQYEKARRRRLTLDSINLRFYFDFIAYFNENKYALNTTGKHIKNIKSAMALAVEEGITANTDWKNRKFKIPAEHPDTVYLTMQELDVIANMEINDKFTAVVRDIFVMACFLGVRYTDLSNITSDDFFQQNGANFIKIRQSKTGSVVIIPLKEVVRNLIEKYNGRIPRVPSNQYMNRELKKIAVIAELNESVKFHRTEGGKVVEHIEPKHSLITTHTARRSFATNMYLAGVPSISIMKITGHKTEKSFLRYIRISQEDNAMKMLSHPFFSDATIKK